MSIAFIGVFPFITSVTGGPFTPGSTATVSVQDAGTGFKLGELERLFETFYTTKAHGMGMGLAISRSIIEAHGGRLWAEPNQGVGATFLFTLPGAAERPGEGGPAAPA